MDRTDDWDRGDVRNDGDHAVRSDVRDDGVRGDVRDDDRDDDRNGTDSGRTASSMDSTLDNHQGNRYKLRPFLGSPHTYQENHHPTPDSRQTYRGNHRSLENLDSPHTYHSVVWDYLRQEFDLFLLPKSRALLGHKAAVETTCFPPL